MTPNVDAAAIKATEILLRLETNPPITPMLILRTMPNVLVLTFAEMALTIGADRRNVLTSFASDNRDVITSVMNVNGELRYVVVYNQRLPFYMLQRGLARELGHIVLQHDGSLPEDVRAEEALIFARHLLCPRPLIKALQESIHPLTVETVGNVTGCYERCLKGIQHTPGANVPAEMNRRVRALFADYIENFVDCYPILQTDDVSEIADFGTYMDNYVE